MLYRQDLSPAQHVARREALTQVARAGKFEFDMEAMIERVLTPIAPRFMGGHRLDGREFEALVADTRAYLEGFGNPVMLERRRPATRVKPKGEEHEFLLAMRVASETKRHPTAYELAGVRIAVTRRRMTFSFEPNGMLVTKHALERSIERGLASWTGRLAEVEDAMLDRLGLASVWRRAFEMGKVATHDIVLPYGDGLILCTLDRNDEPRGSGTVSVTGPRAYSNVVPPSPLLVHPLNHAASESVSVVLCTVIDEDLLNIEQVDIRDALDRFCARHKAFLGDLTASILWRTATIEPPRPAEDLLPGMDALADELVDLLGRPGAREALTSRRRQAATLIPAVAAQADTSPRASAVAII